MVRIKGGVIDCDFDPDSLVAFEGRTQNRFEILAGQAAGNAKVHGGHDGVVETIGIDMDPESVEVAAAQMLNRCFSGASGADALDAGKIKCTQLTRQRLAAKFCLVLGVAKAERDSISRSDQRRVTIEVSERSRSVTGDQGQVHRGGLAIRLRFRLKEVGLSVDEKQSVTAPSPERQCRTEHDGTIATEHNWELASIQQRAHRICQLVRVASDVLSIQNIRLRIAL